MIYGSTSTGRQVNFMNFLSNHDRTLFLKLLDRFFKRELTMKDGSQVNLNSHLGIEEKTAQQEEYTPEKDLLDTIIDLCADNSEYNNHRSRIASRT
jgi:hypothetical protein